VSRGRGLAAALVALLLAALAATAATAPGALASSAAPRTAAEATAAASAEKPSIRWAPIPFPATRKREMRAYAKRHYGINTFQLKKPKVIVEHWTESSTWQSAWDTFAPDVADSELGEKPGVCAHFIVDEKGIIHQLVSIGTMCRHTVGLNYTAIGIEHVGFSDGEVLGNAKEMKASLALTCWLKDREGIAIKNVIGHNESLSSRYHKEKVASLKDQTHDDFKRSSMNAYRDRLKDACG